MRGARVPNPRPARLTGGTRRATRLRRCHTERGCTSGERGWERDGEGAAVMETLAPVVVGFLLTTVLGGTLGYVIQRRGWTHQHTTQLRQEERERAVAIFEEVSRLMDRRLYRLKLLYWSLPAGRADGTRSPLAEPRMDQYRQVLYEWNDGINRNLALVQQYFGEAMRRRLDNVIGSAFVSLGRSVERLWSSEGNPAPAVAPKELDRRLTELSSLVYGFNLQMIRAIQACAVGWLVPEHRRQPATE